VTSAKSIPPSQVRDNAIAQLARLSDLITRSYGPHEAAVFNRRDLVDVYIVAHNVDSSSSSSASPSPSSTSLSSEKKTASWTVEDECRELASWLVLEGKVAAIHIVEGGYSSFVARYPFLCRPFPLVRSPVRFEDAAQYSSEVLDGKLWLSGLRDRRALHDMRITHILNVAEECKPYDDPAFTYLHLPLVDQDTQTISQHFEQANAFIDSGSRVLVHCRQGISRSASFVLAYLLHSNSKHTLASAFQYLVARRSQTYPNAGFWKQLEVYEKSIRGGRSTFAEIECGGRPLWELMAVYHERSKSKAKSDNSKCILC